MGPSAVTRKRGAEVAGLTWFRNSLYHTLSMRKIPFYSALFCLAAIGVTAIWEGPAWPAGGGLSPKAGESRIFVVALDGSGDFRSIQEAIDVAGSGDEVHVKAGRYEEDVTIHSKERFRLVGEGADRVFILGQRRVGSFHIGKWPYGASDVEVTGVTIHEHGGLGLGIFNGKSVVLRNIKIKGMLFGQDVQGVRIENSRIGGSETTGIQFADSHADLIGNFIHDNDHGVTVAGRSHVRLERNIITRSLFEGVVVKDQAKAVLIRNTIVKNGGGVAFLDRSESEVSGNIVGLNRVGFLVAPTSRTTISFNAVYNQEHNYLKAGSPNNIPAPELQAASDLTLDPRFVDAKGDDFRLRPDTPLMKVGNFAYLGALAPAASSP